MMNNELIKGTHVNVAEIGHGEMSLVVDRLDTSRITRHKVCILPEASISTDERDNNEKCFIVWKKSGESHGEI